MDRSFPAVISAGFLICLAFTGAVGAGRVWVPPGRCRMRACEKLSYDEAVQNHCLLPFNRTMVNTNYQTSCPWPHTMIHYMNLMMCLEKEANRTCCTDAVFRHSMLKEIHQSYFSLCSHMHLDPAPPVLLLLIGPCVLFPFLIPFLCLHFKLYEYNLPID